GEIRAMAATREDLRQRAEDAEDGGPEQQAALLARVQRGPEIEGRQVAAGAPRDVGDAEVVVEDRDLERHDGDEQRDTQRESGVARALLEIETPLRRARKARDRSPQAHEEREPEGEMAEQRHLGFGN